MGGGYKIDVFCALRDQSFRHRPQLPGICCFAHGAPGNRAILAIFAAQGTAAKENGAAAAGACQRRLLPHMEHGLGHHGGVRSTAEAFFTGCSVYAAPAGTQLAVYIIHFLTSFPPFYHGFSRFSTLPPQFFVI
jgi:hypothetical protein